MVTGPAPLPAEGMTKFHEEVDKLAMTLCEELGLDPYCNVTVKTGEDLTPYEAQWALESPVLRPDNKPRQPVHWPQDGSPPYEVAEPYMIQPRQTYISVLMWRKFRPQAALALASWRAVHRYALTEA